MTLVSFYIKAMINKSVRINLCVCTQENLCVHRNKRRMRELKAKKLITLSLTAAMAIGTVACGGKSTDNATDANAKVQTNTETSAEERTLVTETTPMETESAASTQQAVAPAGEVSIDFEDGVYGFVGIDKTVNPVGDDSTLSVADFGGSKALKVVSNGKAPYVAIQVDALLGDKAAEVKTVEMSLGIENPDGAFNAVSGKIYAFLGAENERKDGDWSVYLESANPKTAVYMVPDEMSFGEGNYMVVSLETDNGKDAGAAPAILYIDNIAFKDASGNVIAADTTAEYVSTATEADRSNLANIIDAVEFEGFAAKGDGWAQNGFAMTEDILAALVPGSVVEISFTSESGDMWIVMNEAEAGWMRVGDGTNGSSTINDSKTTAQIPFEMLAEYCGDDVSKWGTTMQCEASGAWEVFSVKVLSLIHI